LKEGLERVSPPMDSKTLVGSMNPPTPIEWMKQNTNNRKGATWRLAESTCRNFLVYLQGALFNKQNCARQRRRRRRSVEYFKYRNMCSCCFILEIVATLLFIWFSLSIMGKNEKKKRKKKQLSRGVVYWVIPLEYNFSK